MTLKSDLTLADWPQGSHVPCLSLYFLIHYRVHWYLPCRAPASDKAVSVPRIAAGSSWLRQGIIFHSQRRAMHLCSRADLGDKLTLEGHF